MLSWEAGGLPPSHSPPNSSSPWILPSKVGIAEGSLFPKFEKRKVKTKDVKISSMLLWPSKLCYLIPHLQLEPHVTYTWPITNDKIQNWCAKLVNQSTKYPWGPKSPSYRMLQLLKKKLISLYPVYKICMLSVFEHLIFFLHTWGLGFTAEWNSTHYCRIQYEMRRILSHSTQ